MIRCLLLFLSVSMIVSCKKAEERQLEKDKQIIQDYLKDNNLTAECTDSGLYYIIEEEGTGDRPTISSEVLVNYKGYYPDNTVFEDSPNTSNTFSLTGVIEGWQQGIPLFKEGGNGTLFIPSKLAYGPNGRGQIGGDAVIFFDIELVEIVD